MNLENIRSLGRKLRNWGRWGPEDELGTVNFITQDKIVKAARLVKKGKAFSLALPFDKNGPQPGFTAFNRFNPIHLMLTSGADVVAGAQDHLRGLRYADDIIIMPLQCGTQWDALSHIFDGDKMWNGYDARLVTSYGAKKNGIEKMKDKLLGRGILLDFPSFKGKEWLEPGEVITPKDLDECAAKEGVEVGQGDILLIRTGFMYKCLKNKNWGSFVGGNYPGLIIETAEWLYQKEVAAIASDTEGVEVNPGEASGVIGPWHIIVLPNIGLSVGEMWYLDELAFDCVKDGVYEFLLVAQPLPITGAVGSPVNPIAIK